ncbi:hypothetical protein BC826DRAFT_1125529 [Russula brevipes]|nr:hypothetical protein BC826DRAFT_1125529 [Russula brevipes]
MRATINLSVVLLALAAWAAAAPSGPGSSNPDVLQDCAEREIGAVLFFIRDESTERVASLLGHGFEFGLLWPRFTQILSSMELDPSVGNTFLSLTKPSFMAGEPLYRPQKLSLAGLRDLSTAVVKMLFSSFPNAWAPANPGVSNGHKTKNETRRWHFLYLMTEDIVQRQSFAANTGTGAGKAHFGYASSFEAALAERNCAPPQRHMESNGAEDTRGNNSPRPLLRRVNVRNGSKGQLEQPA